MRKEGIIFGILFFVSLLNFSFVSSAPCDLGISLVNQDPYLASPGDQLRLVFQVTGLENSECKDVLFELISKYPIELNPDQNSTYFIKSGTYQKDFSSFFLASYKVRLSTEAISGDNLIQVRYKFSGNNVWVYRDFYLNVEDTEAEFELHVKDYKESTNELTFQILNIANSDVKALSVEVPKQENVKIIGSNINIVGDLDSNEYTTAEFKAIPMDGNILLKISYSDLSGNRRIVEELVNYDSEYFVGFNNESKISFSQIFWLLLVIFVVGYYFYRRHKKKSILREKLKR